MAIEHVLKLMGTNIDKVTEKFGKLKMDPIVVDGLLKDGDIIANTLKVSINLDIFLCMIEKAVYLLVEMSFLIPF